MSADVSTVLVTGATGTVSTAVLGALNKAAGVRIRALVRDPAKAEGLRQAGHEVVVANLEEPDSLAEAFDRVDVLWLLAPAAPLAPSMVSNAIWAARRAKVGHIVRMSAIRAGYDAPTRNGRLHALSDEELKASGVAWTILRPHYFMQNLLSSAASVAADATLYMNLGGANVGMIDTRDIGEFAARILENPRRHTGKVYTPTGPESTSMAAAAETLGRALGKPVNYVALPQDAARAAMLGFGLQQWFVGMLIEYGQAYSEGWGDFVTSDFKAVTGREPRPFAQFAADFAPAFGGAVAVQASHA
jgi:uncharacterized protein YbjT (DUF2867 family)